MSKRDEYVKKLKVKLDDWNTDLDKLEAKAEHVKEDLKEKYHEEINVVRERRSDIKDKLKELVNCSENAWEELKLGAEEVGEKLNEAIERVHSKF